MINVSTLRAPTYTTPEAIDELLRAELRDAQIFDRNTTHNNEEIEMAEIIEPTTDASDTSYYFQQKLAWAESLKDPLIRASFLSDSRQNLLKQGIEIGAQFSDLNLTQEEKETLTNAFKNAFLLSIG
jgi:hypothetical protein